MKNLLILLCHGVTTRPICVGLLFFLPLWLVAQSGEPVSDTSYFLKQGNLFYGVQTKIYADGSEITTKTLVGDTTALVDGMMDRITGQAATMAVDARHVSTSRKRLNDLLRESDNVLSLTGIDPQKEVEIEYHLPFLESGWTIKNGGAGVPIDFSMSAQNNLRYSVNGGALKQLDLCGNVIRLRQFTGSADVELYKLKEGGKWVDLNRTVTLIPPSGGD
jgi:hypothetical protein